MLPKHYYSSVPDIHELSASDGWKRPRTMYGVQGADDVDAQLATLTRWLSPGLPPLVWEAACREHGEPGYGVIEGDVLYGFVRNQQPERIVQVGAGVSTAIMLRAARDVNYSPTVTCVDPFPTAYLVRGEASGDLTLIAEPAQDVAEDVFLELTAGDFLFVDSTHTVKPGSEVNRLVLDILPRLPEGLWVHFHDITFPYDYSRGLLSDDVFFWSESALVNAFLLNNPRYTVRVSMSMLHYGRPEGLGTLLPHYRPQANDHGLRLPGDTAGRHFPSSTYLQVVS